MKSPNLEAMIEAEFFRGRGVVYQRNSAYKYVLDQLTGFSPYDLVSASELHAMINTGMVEPSYSILANELYLLIQEKYILANHTVPLAADGIIDRYLVDSLRRLLIKLLEDIKPYVSKLP